MPTITDTFTVSDGDQQRPAIRTIRQQDPLIIAVDVWTQQGTRGDKDYDLLSASAIIAGSSAQAFLDNFSPGDPVQISGELVVEKTDGGYLNTEIEKARWSFVPTGRDTSQQPQNPRQQPQQTRSQGQQQGGQGRPPQSPQSRSGGPQDGQRPPQQNADGQGPGRAPQAGNRAPGR